MPRASEEKKRFVRRLQASFLACTEQSAAYGACLKLHMEGVSRGACEQEFAALHKCFKAALRSKS